ncbi:MAG: response regulator transcription factor [Chloroflexota bacterium]
MEGSNDQEAIRVVVVDDHPASRDGLCAYLDSAAGTQVVGTGASGTEALDLAQDLRPDVVILELRLPDSTGVEIANRLCSEFPDVGVLVITAFYESGYLRPLLKAGARGYLSKTASATAIQDAVRMVAAGKTVVEGDAVRALAEHSDIALTATELKVVRLLLSGKRNAEIARAIDRSQTTVEYHLTHIYAKLDVRSRAEAIVKVRNTWQGA